MSTGKAPRQRENEIKRERERAATSQGKKQKQRQQNIGNDTKEQETVVTLGEVTMKQQKRQPCSRMQQGAKQTDVARMQKQCPMKYGEGHKTQSQVKEQLQMWVYTEGVTRVFRLPLN
eukprot:TRINITY_DN3644_c0_g2_i2.p2 TRINITY_DN3644_c0_g2~~TRINITY_DN3644_c0_g2_i2.p2  ORF type:complete len:118 (+),score=1.91 TRINITY_DN3644_c0_g2_i2:140-493(+)